jgi:DNA-binding NarL/FixJ family response regulator
MQHWIVDQTDSSLPSWREAMPAAEMLQRDLVGEIGVIGPAIIWCRLHSGEDVAAVLGGIVGYVDGKPLVVLGDEPSDDFVMQALSAGASGCCNTYAAPEVLRQVALVVGNGGLWVGQSLLQKLIASTSRILGERGGQPPRDDWSRLLSDREAQVARLVARGASNKEIARQLAITERTVKSHLTNIFEKLGLRDRLQLSFRINAGFSTPSLPSIPGVVAEVDIITGKRKVFSPTS